MFRLSSRSVSDIHSKHPAVAPQDGCLHPYLPQVMQQVNDKLREKPGSG